MKKSAFSMIELIFVIIILGILSGVILAKLAATRDDAIEAVTCQNIATCITDMAAIYTSKNNASLSDSASCTSDLVSSHIVSLNSNGDSIIVNGAPSHCSYMNGTHLFGGNRVSI